MKLLDFLTRFKATPAFSIREVAQLYPGFEQENLLNWQKKGHILRIRNGWYSVSGRISTEEHLYWIANKVHLHTTIGFRRRFLPSPLYQL
jgi:predicted transcriptional regulator of viral defense system